MRRKSGMLRKPDQRSRKLFTIYCEIRPPVRDHGLPGTVCCEICWAMTEWPAVVQTWTPQMGNEFLEITFTAVPLANQPFGNAFRDQPGYYNGCTLTILGPISSLRPGQSTRASRESMTTVPTAWTMPANWVGPAAMTFPWSPNRCVWCVTTMTSTQARAPSWSNGRPAKGAEKGTRGPAAGPVS